MFTHGPRPSQSAMPRSPRASAEDPGGVFQRAVKVINAGAHGVDDECGCDDRAADCGPTLRAMLKPMLLRATALGTSTRGTMSPTDACQAGAKNAEPTQMEKVKRSSVHGPMSPNQANKESAKETMSMKICAKTMTRRRSMFSAIAPATRERSMIRRDVEVWTRATMSGDGAIWSIIQDAPTDWMSLPKFESRLAVQTPRKTGKRKGESAEGAPASFMGWGLWGFLAGRAR